MDGEKIDGEMSVGMEMRIGVGMIGNMFPSSTSKAPPCGVHPVRGCVVEVSRMAWTSLSLFAWSLSSRRISFPCCADAGERLSWQTATMLDTILMICVRFSLTVGEGVGERKPDSTLWMA